MIGLKQKVASGIFWNATARIGQQFVQFSISVYLARLLAPEAFGLVGMVAVFTSFASIFADVGFASALIQKTDVTELHVQSVFWLNIICGFALALCFYLCAPFIASFYSSPALQPLTRAFAINFILIGISVVPQTLLRKKMHFSKTAKISLVSTMLSGICAVALAFKGAGVWSLVLQTLMNSFFSTLFLCYACRWQPRLVFSLAALKELFQYTINLFGFTFLNYWSRNADNLLVGKFFGSTALGYYSRAYELMLLPITQVISVVSSVMFSALARIQHDKERVKRIYLRMIGIISLIVFPLMIGLWVAARPFVLTLYGEKWVELIPLLKILSLLGISQSVSNPVGWIYNSQGRTDLLFRWGVCSSIITVGSILIGIWLGSVESVALSYACTGVLLFYPSIMIPGRLINMNVADVFKAVAGPLTGSVVMGLCLFVLSLLIPFDWQEWQKLMILTFVGMCIYGIFVVALRVPAWNDIVGIFRERRLARRSSDVLTTSQAD